MGACFTSTPDLASVKSLDITPSSTPDSEKIVSAQKAKDSKFTFVHTKHYERYFNRQFKVSVCAVKGERRTMEDDHLCQFEFSKHPNYSLFGIFDGHNGADASKYVAEHLYETLNNLEDLENNEDIIAVIKQMDQEFITNTDYNAGCTIVFAITRFDAALNLPKAQTIRSQVSQPDITSMKTPSLHQSLAAGKLLLGFDLDHTGRVFWLGDARRFLVRADNSFEALTVDHNTTNKAEVSRIEGMGGKIVNGRVDGLLCVTRAFGDRRIKYDGSGVICEPEYMDFEANANMGDALLLSCDGLTEKWSDRILMNKLAFHLNAKKDGKIDTARNIGDLVDDAIIEGSADNISVMLIQFEDGRKREVNKKYANV